MGSSVVGKAILDVLAMPYTVGIFFFFALWVPLSAGLGGMFGGVFGGWLGDRLNRVWPYGGRCAVAQLSVVLGTLFFVAAPCPRNLEVRGANIQIGRS